MKECCEKWKNKENITVIKKRTECGYFTPDFYLTYPNFCPECGSKLTEWCKCLERVSKVNGKCICCDKLRQSDKPPKKVGKLNGESYRHTPMGILWKINEIIEVLNEKK